MTNSNQEEVKPVPSPSMKDMDSPPKNDEKQSNDNHQPQLLPSSSGSVQNVVPESVAGPSYATQRREESTEYQFVVRKSISSPCATDKKNGEQVEEPLVEEKISYKEYCVSDLNSKTLVVQKMRINERRYYSIRRAFGHPEEVIQTTRPNISYRTPISDEKKKALLSSMLKKELLTTSDT